MGGRDATDHSGMTVEALSEEDYEKAWHVLALASERAGASKAELLDVLEAVGHPGALKARQARLSPPPTSRPVRDADGLFTGERAPKPAPPSRRRDPSRCGKGLHKRTEGNTRIRGDGRKDCLDCERARNKAGGRPKVKRDPKLCWNQRHERSPENTATWGDGTPRCRPCQLETKRRWRADNRAAGKPSQRKAS